MLRWFKVKTARYKCSHLYTGEEHVESVHYRGMFDPVKIEQHIKRKLECPQKWSLKFMEAG